MNKNPTPAHFQLSCYLVWILLALLSVLPTHAAEWYLNKSATGTGAGNSLINGWTTVSAIKWNLISTGDILWINGGNYDEHFDIFNKTNLTARIHPQANQKAVFRGAQIWGGNNVTIDGYHNDTQFFVFRGNTSHGTNGYLIRTTTGFTLRGIEVERDAIFRGDTTQNHGIAVNGTVSKGTIENCHIHHTSGDGINIIAPSPNEDIYDNFVIRNNRIINIGDDGIQAGSNKGMTVDGNYIDNNGQASLFGGHPDGFQLNPDGGNVIVSNNTFVGFNQNIFIEQAVKNIYLYNNVLIGTRTSGTDRGLALSVRNHATFAGTFLVANNVLYNFNSYIGIGGENVHNVTGKIVANNVFINCKIIITSGMATLLDATNIYWDLPGAKFYATAGNDVQVYNRSSGAARRVDPAMINPLAHNFRPAHSLSPLIGTGSNLRDQFKTDISGINRNESGFWTVGAYHFDGTTMHPPTAPSNLRVNIEKN